MSTVSFNLPDSVYKKIQELAESEGISVDQFLATAAAEKLAALTSVEYLEERAARGSREKLHRILDRVPHVPPDPGDEL
ncbi:MAG: ribbon-helix-helix protein, CopG family [Gemmatimonadetes bacterium]|nr:ribbon-helix-helix protein, CopG family [Gemmatimonadota bacterium]